MKEEVSIPPSNNFFKALRTFFEEVAGLTKFTIRFLVEVFKPKYEFKELIRQCYSIGYKSFSLIAVTGLIMGLILSIQSRPSAARLPSVVAIRIISELGPMITALLFIGKVGSGIGAELASMKATNHIETLQLSGKKPFKFLVVTRVLAATLMLPLLVIFSDTIALVGAFIGVNVKGEVSFILFFSQVFGEITFSDLIPAVIKTFFFGFAISIIGSYHGYNAGKKIESVGIAVNSSVVYASLMVFILDVIAAQLSSLLK